MYNAKGTICTVQHREKRGREMAVTIRDVSEKCGLSISTVSKALNHYSDISEETRKRVLVSELERSCAL